MLGVALSRSRLVVQALGKIIRFVADVKSTVSDMSTANSRRQLVGRKRGRPARPGIGVWRHPEVLSRRVATIVGERDREDAESVTATAYRLEALARRVLAPRTLTGAQRTALHRLARAAKPSAITRTLLSWRFNLSDVTVRRLQREADGVFVMHWR
jgi:hypothetical protein